jgi:Flp pilus assembly protein TadD
VHRVIAVVQPLASFSTSLSREFRSAGRRDLSRFETLIALSFVLAAEFTASMPKALASDLKIPLSQRSLSTPTQKLNREGVTELKRGHREKAKRLFYRAYLLDPDDPFTLNNLGYVAELAGDADQALRFYALAAKEHTDAMIDESSDPQLKGKSLGDAYRQVEGSEDQIKRISEQVIVMFHEGEVFEARNLLRSALQKHPQNPFLLNNLGYAMETVGDLEDALRFYSAAAGVHSKELAVVTPRAKWRGRPISEIAAANAAAVNEQIARGEDLEAMTARLNLQGVAALNDNRPQAARAFFLQAYRRDPRNAFTLNNLGYIAELEGDRETAEFYYTAARSGTEANQRVTYSTRREAEGEKIDNLANENTLDVDATIRAAQAKRRRSNEPIELIPRSSSPKSGGPEVKPVPPLEVPAPALPAPSLPDSDTERENERPIPPPETVQPPNSLPENPEGKG